MALSGSRGMPILALIGLLGIWQVSAGTGRQSFFQLAPLENSVCLPKNFERLLPRPLKEAAAECRGGLQRGGRRQPVRFVITGSKGNARFLDCLAKKLNIANQSGVSATKLGAVIETLSTNSTLTSRWKENADICLKAMSSGLSPRRQGIYILSCLRKRILLDCAMLGHKTKCLKATCLSGLNLSSKFPGLVTNRVWSNCRRRVQRARPASIRRLRGRINSCTVLYREARATAACALRETALATENALDVAAVRKTIKQGGNGRNVNQLIALLERCKDTSLNVFLTCWSNSAPEQCATSEAHQLAAAFQPGRPAAMRRMPMSRRRG